MAETKASKKMTYRVFHRPWRAKKPFYLMMIVELSGIIPMLVLFGLAQPDNYRTELWQVGYDNGFNSDPNMILYAYANHRPLPTVPFVWSQELTNFNVAISVLSLFVLLTKMIASIMKVYYPVIGTTVAVVMTALYATSIYGQAGPDYADPRYPSPVAWYIPKSCDYAASEGAVGSCKLAKATFGVTCYMLAIYLVNLGFAVWAMWPNKMLDVMEDSDDEDEESRGSSRGRGVMADKELEMHPPMQTPRSLRGTPYTPGPFTPGTGTFTPGPFTPRTQAFHTLDRKLPLRS